MLTSKQFEAVITAMFGIENEIQHIEYLLTSTDHAANQDFLAAHLERRKEHYKALKELIEG